MAIPVSKPKAPHADKGFDGWRPTRKTPDAEHLANNPATSNRSEFPPCDFCRFRDLNCGERMWAYLKQFRHVATRYDKAVLFFGSYLNLAALR